MVSVCLPSDALLEHLPSYLGFSYLGCGMAGWHHWLDGRESGWTPGVGDGQGGLAYYNSWSRKESDTTEQLNWLTEPLWLIICSLLAYLIILYDHHHTLSLIAFLSVGVAAFLSNPYCLYVSSIWTLIHLWRCICLLIVLWTAVSSQSSNLEDLYQA